MWGRESFKHRSLALLVGSGLIVSTYIFFLKITQSAEVRPDLTESLLPKNYLNKEILSTIKLYKEGGTKQRKEAAGANYGVTEDIFYQGRKVAAKGPASKAYCSGITFEVYMKAATIAAGSDFVLNGLSASNIERFRKDWYGVDGNRRTMVDALVSRNLGIEILDPNNAAPGDFVQFWWRDGFGHSVVFLGWIRDAKGQISGIRYWSAQGNGIGEAQDMVGGVGRLIDAKQIYIARAYEP